MMSGELPPRRKACDRCRSHKLRCRRDQEVCIRCQRAGAVCVTSVGSKIGRPTAESRRRLEQPRQEQERPGHSIPMSSEVELQNTQVPTPASTVPDEHAEPNWSTQATCGTWQPVPRSGSNNTDSASINPTSVNASSLSTQRQAPVTDHAKALDILDASEVLTLPPPLDKQEECVRRLTALHSALVLDLNIVKECQTADKCTAIISMPEFANNYNFVIGRMLSGSAKFIEILEEFAPRAKASVNQQPLRCDVPTLLSILTCYVYVIRIYRIIFMCILKSVQNQPLPPTPMPALFPGIHLGGFSLEAHLDLQVKILVQVGESLLKKIDVGLGLSDMENQPQQIGLLGLVPGASDLVQSMLEKELAEEQHDGMLRGCHQTLPEIFSSLKSI